MSDFNEPIQTVSSYYKTNSGESAKYTIELSPNEYLGKDGIIGFVPDNPEPYTFFSVQKDKKEKLDPIVGLPNQ